MKPANAAKVTRSADARTDIALEIPLVAEDHRLPRKFRDLFGAKGPVADDLVKRLAAEIAVEHQFALQADGRRKMQSDIGGVLHILPVTLREFAVRRQAVKDNFYVATVFKKCGQRAVAQ